MGRSTSQARDGVLTYADGDAFRPRHISAFLKHVRQWLARRGRPFPYVWVAELQKRGALHYHVVIWLPRGLTIPKPDKQGWWPHGMTRVEWAQFAVGYLCKYISKFDGVQAFPKGLRLHGSGGHEKWVRPIRRWQNLPTWLRGLVGVNSHVARRTGLGLVDLTTGVLWRSPWTVSVRKGRVFVRELFKYDNALRDLAGPYSMLTTGDGP